jgi:hypothetical protein
MKEVRERVNLVAFCGWGSLVKEARGEVRCRVHVEERRGAVGVRSAREGGGGPVANKARHRRSRAAVNVALA